MSGRILTKYVIRRVTLLTIAITCLLFCFPKGALAPPEPTYYNTVDTRSAATLRATLHDVIKDHTRFPYTSTAPDTWDILESADEDPQNSNNILDVYKNASYLKVGGGTGPYEREHTWPKSYGFPVYNAQNYPYTDCHHLFLCDGAGGGGSAYNQSRGTKPYRYCDATCEERPTDFNNGRGGGTGTYPGNSNWTTTGTWETWIGRRGDVARALFYLDVRYEGETHGITGVLEPDLILTDNDALIVGSDESPAYMGMKSVLLQWHVEDPVDDLELHRNDIIEDYQGNRNPFIDHPEWVECIFNNTNCTGDKCAGADINGNGVVSFPDFAILTQYWLDTDCATSNDCEGADLDPEELPDGDVDMTDLAVLAEHWLDTGCLD